MSGLVLEHLTKRFGPVAAVDDVTLSVAHGTFVCLLGPSGCGKTTLLRMIAGLEEPSAGRILIDGADITGSTRIGAISAWCFSRSLCFRI